MLAETAATVAPQISAFGILANAVLILGLLVLSGLFSGSEAVLFSLTPAQLQHEARSPSALRRLVATMMQRPERTLMIILVANTAVNVLLFSSSYVFFERLRATYGGDWITPVSAVFSILLVVVFGEVVPKVLGVSLCSRLAPLVALLVRTAGYVCGPIGRLIEFILVMPINRVFFADVRSTAAAAHDLTPEELKTLLEMNRRRGLLNPTEDMMLREVINLSDTRVRDVMVPRVDMVAFDINDPPEKLNELMRSTRLKKVPVYDGSIDQMLGLIYAKVLYFNTDKSLRDLIVPVFFVPELITCEQVLEYFRDTRSQIAIAVDEFGGVAGLVALEDVLEEIVGDIHDPDDQPEDPELVRLSDTEYEISGALSVHYWAEIFGLQRFAERVATVGGLVAARLGRTPRVGDVIRIVNLELRVTKMQQRRVGRLHLRLLLEDASEGGRP